jgi:hypothetical protein
MVAINNSINDKVGASNTGVTNTLTIDNASNTASSQALVNITVGGTTAGDAFETFTVSGTTNWSIGTDNSVTGDPFVIAGSTALGTTNIMSALTTGEINYPLLPAFLATLSAPVNNQTGDGTSYTVVYNTEIFDQGGDSVSGTFTAPVTGRYQLMCNGDVSGITTGMTAGTWTITTSNRAYRFGLMRWGVVMTATNTCTVGGGTLSDMDAADTATVILQLSNGTKVADIATANYFSGYLAC